MNILKTHFRGHHARRRFFFRATVIVCLLLMTLLSVAQVVHTHPNPNAAYTCPLCVTMHTVVPAAAAAALIILVELGTPVPVSEGRALVRYWNPKLFTRPPPGAC